MTQLLDAPDMMDLSMVSLVLIKKRSAYTLVQIPMSSVGRLEEEQNGSKKNCLRNRLRNRLRNESTGLNPATNPATNCHFDKKT